MNNAAGEMQDPPRILVVDIGGNNIKFRISGENGKRKFESGPEMTPGEMVERVHADLGETPFDVVAIGYPGPVRRNRIILEPHNLGKGWKGFDFEAAFGKPVKLVNDALMQALGSYDGGTMLFLGLGTGLGGAMIVEGTPVPLEVAHMPYRDGKTFEDFVGRRGLDALGKAKWKAAVRDVVEIIRKGLVADEVVLGGGNAKKFRDDLPPHCRLGDNENAFAGGERLWV